MAQIPSTLSGEFVAEVKAYNKTTRELEVFIPKLMPGIPEGRKDIFVMTNYGNKTLKVNCREKIKTSSTITAKAYDTEEPLPTIGSKVMIKFLEEAPEYCYWTKFNMNFDYDVIEEEKYARQFYMNVGDKKLIINRDDTVNFILPEHFDVVLQDTEYKNKIVKLIENDKYYEDIIKLKNIIGEKPGLKTVENEFGEKVQVKTEGSGLLLQVEYLLREVEKLKEDNSNLNNIIKLAGLDKLEDEEETIDIPVEST